MYLPHSGEETLDQVGTSEMPGENEPLPAGEPGAWQEGLVEEIP